MKTNDEIIKINLTNNRLSHFDDENLKEKARKMGRLEIRIALVDIGKNEPEILATNLTSEEFSTEDLKELYGKRWSVETGFDRLKKFNRNRRFQRNSKNNNRTRFSRPHIRL
ncbi:transposase [Methanobrevibacter sp. V74]|uniref:transposase n=1 Tax=Methanobrevibacter sp. V74 TaxID=3064279 RepID=UPI0027361C12|nr:transposase [Methanobrevibacter sp. V74]